METPMLLLPTGDQDSVTPLETSSENAFIVANTLPASLGEIRDQHIIPVYSKDNEPLISHADFIEAAYETVYQFFPQEVILEPSVRVSTFSRTIQGLGCFMRSLTSLSIN